MPEKARQHKEDARVAKTKARLREALLACMQEKPLDTITATELCARAGVSRNTFYAHYPSPVGMLDTLVSELGEKNSRVLAASRRTGGMEWIKELCENIQAESDLYGALIESEELRDYVKQQIEDAYELVLRASKREIRENPDSAYVFAFAAGGATALIERWIREGATRPTSEVASLIAGYCQHGLIGALG